MNINIDTSKIRLETDRLILRAFCEDDLSDFYEYASVPGIGEMAGWPHHENIETSKRILQGFMTEKEVFALVLKETAKVIGSLGLHYSWANEEPKYAGMKSKEIGYVLSRNYWGQGLVPEELERNTNLEARTIMFERLQKSGVGNIGIAFSDCNPCGMVSSGKSRDADLADYAEIVAIYSLEEYWGKGVGCRLMRLALTELKRKGYKSVLLWTFEVNTRARRFYEKHGFVADDAVKDSGFGNAKEVRYRRDL